jgi:hypothetical protein
MWPGEIPPGWEHENASRLLITLVIMIMQFGWINAFNKMCAGLKE